MAENMVAEEKQTLVSKKDLVKAWWRWTTAVEVPVSFDRMQALAFGYSMNGVMRKIYKDKPEELKDAMKRHTSMFNTNCDWGSIIHGITISLEEQRALGHEDEITPEMIQSLKIGLMGPLAGIGDSLVVGTLIPILLGIALGLSTGGSVVGPIFYIVAWNLIMAFGMKFLYFKGYELGGKAVDILVGEQATAIREAIVMLGTMVVGSVAATWVSVKTSFHLVNSAGKEFLNLQNQLDGVYPGFLTAAFVIFCWWLMSKKKVSPVVTMLILVVVAFIGVMIGFFNPGLKY